jgi:superfamily I DNA and/or RNA helicase
LENDNYVCTVNGDLDRIGNRFGHDVYNFKSSEDITVLGGKIMRKANFQTRENYYQISEGDFVLLKYINSDNNKTTIGYVKEITNDYIVKVIAPRFNINESNDLKMIKLVSNTTCEKTLEALKTITTEFCCHPNIQNILFSEYQNDFYYDLNTMSNLTINEIDPSSIDIDNKYLNSSQKEALLHAITKSFTLIQGPPGTGKTTVAVDIIIEWLKLDSKNPILVCADSNIAVDILYKELISSGVPTTRLGIGSNLNEEYGSILTPSEKFSLIKNNISKSNVICCTCVGSLSDYIKEISFKRIIIDEATQATELSTIIPLTKGTEQLVLIGDHKQLSPTIVSFTAQKNGLNVSLFERLVNKGLSPLLLKVQYRMHPSISMFPSMYFYNSLLLNGVKEENRPIIQGFDWPKKSFHVALINIKGTEKPNRTSIYNIEEIDVLIKILIKILKAKSIKPEDIGIVTPYDAQKKIIREELKIIFNKEEFSLLVENPDKNNKKPPIEVDTIDGFQGMEKELIIISTVRSNKNVKILLFKYL